MLFYLFRGAAGDFGKALVVELKRRDGAERPGDLALWSAQHVAERLTSHKHEAAQFAVCSKACAHATPARA